MPISTTHLINPPTFKLGDLLRSQRPPSSEELQIAKAEHASATLEIARIDDAVNELLLLRQALLTSNSQYIGIQSRIRDIPVELISKIFEFCLPERSVYWQYSIRSPMEPPLLLMQICQRWREIALATPSLWCKFTADLDNRGYKADLSLSDLWFSRARNHPLSLKLGSPFRLDYATNSSRFMDMILLISHRIVYLNLNMTHDVAVHFGNTRIELPRLQKIRIYVSLWSTESDQPLGGWSLDFTDNAPYLRQVEIAMETGFDKLLLPWQMITHLRMQGGGSLFEVKKLLARCPNLLELEIDRTWGDGDRPASCLVLSKLHTLRIGIQMLDPNILGQATLPALRELHLNFLGYSNVDQESLGLTDTIDFLTRSAYALRHLRLSAMTKSLTDNDLMQILQRVPTVVELHIKKSAVFALSISLLSSLTYFSPPSHHGSVTLPHLEVLELDYDPRFFNDEQMANMIASRCLMIPKTSTKVVAVPQCRLRTARIKLSGSMNTMRETTKVLRVLKSNGLQTSVTTDDQLTRDRFQWLLL